MLQLRFPTMGLLLLLLLVALCAPVATAWSTGAPSSSLFTKQRHANPTTSTSLAVASPTRRFWSSRNSRNDMAARKQIIQSKPRPTVIYDPTAGTVTTKDLQSSNKWGSFKSKLYGTMDSVSSVASKLRGNKDRTDVRPPTGGYNDVIERRVFTETTTTGSQTPAQRLMKEYQQKGPALEVVQPEGSVFDSFKESVYSAADGMFQEKPKALPPVQPLQSFKAATQPSIAASIQVREALPQLNSRNPVKRWMAERKIRHWEDEQRKRDEALERERQIESIKENVYAVVDTVQAGAALMAKTPERIVETASSTKRVAIGAARWVATLPDAVQFAANSVAAIPAQVSQTVAGVQESVDNIVKSTQQFVDDVLSTPEKVQRTVKETQQNIENTVKAFDTTVTNVKVWTGLEEPPPPPPKELTFSNIAWELAGGVAQGGSQVAWWLGKGAVQLGFKGAQSAFVAATAAPTKEQVVTTAAARQPKPPQVPPPLSVLDTSELDVDITEALQLAQMALKNAENNESAVGNSDIEEAVRLAKQAAIAATRDAVEIEDQIKKRKKDTE